MDGQIKREQERKMARRMRAEKEENGSEKTGEPQAEKGGTFPARRLGNYGGTMKNGQTGSIAAEEIERRRELFTGLAKEIWENPEPAYREFFSSRRTAETLEKLGFDVTLGAYGIPTAIRASWGSGHPVIGLLGEYDALADLSQKAKPEKEPVKGQKYGHACGHNLLGVGHLAAAAAMKKEMEERNLPGTVIFYGCPAEEVGTGKGFMAKNGAFKECDIAMAYHPSWFSYIFTGGKAGVHSVKAEFFGKSSHSGSSPHNGRSALLAAEMAKLTASLIHEQLPPGSTIHGAVADGGFSPGQIPAYAKINFSMKAANLQDMELVYQRLKKILEAAAMATETEVKYERRGGCCPLLNNRVLAETAFEAMCEAPQEPWTEEEIAFAKELNNTAAVQYQNKKREAGADGTDMQILEGVLPMREFDTNGCTDVGDVSHIVPTIFFKVCCYAMGVNGHTWQAAACAGSSLGMKGMLFAAKVLAIAGLKVIERPEIAARAKEEFDRETKGQPYVTALPEDFSVETALE